MAASIVDIKSDDLLAYAIRNDDTQTIEIIRCSVVSRKIWNLTFASYQNTCNDATSYISHYLDTTNVWKPTAELLARSNQDDVNIIMGVERAA